MSTLQLKDNYSRDLSQSQSLMIEGHSPPRPIFPLNRGEELNADISQAMMVRKHLPKPSGARKYTVEEQEISLNIKAEQIKAKHKNS